MDQTKSFLSNILKPTHSQDFVYKHDTQVQRKAPALNSNAKGQTCRLCLVLYCQIGCCEQASLIYSLLLYVSFSVANSNLLHFNDHLGVDVGAAHDSAEFVEADLPIIVLVGY